MTTYLVIYEQGHDSWGASCPDLPGCTAVGSSRDEVEEIMREAVEAHVDLLRAEGLDVPPPASVAGYVAASCVREAQSRRTLGATAAGSSGRSDVSERVGDFIRVETVQD